VNAVLRHTARVPVAREVMRVRKVIDRGHCLRGELASIRLDAAERNSAEAHAVIAARAADESNTLRLALRLPIGERDLERRIDRLRSRVAEEHAVDLLGQHPRELLRELEGERMSHLERRRVVHDAGLFADGRGDRFAAMAGVHAPEAGGAVEDLSAVSGGIVHVFRGDEHARRALERAVRGKGHPQLFERRQRADGGGAV